MKDFKSWIKNIEYPLMIISSKAGEGNFTVGEAIFDIVDPSKEKKVFHFIIEDLISVRLYKKHFLRYKYICFNSPWLLYLIYYLPINYLFGYLQELFFCKPNLEILKEKILDLNPRTIVCTNHRACFWVSALKRRKIINPYLVGVLTDYHFNPGWKFIFWDKVDFFLGPIEEKFIPKSITHKYIKIKPPLKKEFYRFKYKDASYDNVLITGGGWGLGPIYRVVRLLSKKLPNLNLFVVCGSNEELYSRLKKDFFNKSNIYLYRKVESIYPLLQQCASIITKPGGIILTEAFEAKKKIFIIDGLPGTEQKNALYALKYFNASYFSFKNFLKWYRYYKNIKYNEELL